jgi:hypothetical protein
MCTADDTLGNLDIDEQRGRQRHRRGHSYEWENASSKNVNPK